MQHFKLFICPVLLSHNYGKDSFHEEWEVCQSINAKPVRPGFSPPQNGLMVLTYSNHKSNNAASCLLNS